MNSQIPRPTDVSDGVVTPVQKKSDLLSRFLQVAQLDMQVNPQRFLREKKTGVGRRVAGSRVPKD